MLSKKRFPFKTSIFDFLPTHHHHRKAKLYVRLLSERAFTFGRGEKVFGPDHPMDGTGPNPPLQHGSPPLRLIQSFRISGNRHMVFPRIVRNVSLTSGESGRSAAAFFAHFSASLYLPTL